MDTNIDMVQKYIYDYSFLLKYPISNAQGIELQKYQYVKGGIGGIWKLHWKLILILKFK